MFDFHIHSSVSFDSDTPASDIAQAAKQSGLCEICFTDHWDYLPNPNDAHNLFSLNEYSQAYDKLSIDGLTIRRGVEIGLNEWNASECKKLLSKRDFDFVIGSVHYADGYDPYDKKYWDNKSVEKAYMRYLEKVLECVKLHTDFDVLGHLTYVCKSPNNPFHAPLSYRECSDIADEIMSIIISNGKGMEINTSGVDRGVDLLPSLDYVRRFKELGGEIITVGSDSHDATRVGQYCHTTIDALKDIFGYVCTFEKRRPIFHKI